MLGIWYTKNTDIKEQKESHIKLLIFNLKYI
jgi:hypothetical protein